MKIMLAEDTKDLNRAVCAVLTREGYSVDTAYDGEEALRYIIQDSYDVIILDIMMPKMTGLEVLAEIRRRHILTPVMLLTAKAEIDDRVAGLDAGADDYLPKPFAIKELLARVRAMTRRYTDFSGNKVSYDDINLSSDDLTLSSGNSVRLSIKEFELMHILIMNPDIELTTQYILERVWKTEPEADENTVWLYISYLRAKLAAVGSSVSISGSRGGSFKLVKQPE
ncbi:MAG: response regulator transcription factor [Lachnospiraceae bacterium]|nr:response regulator transcription factor [Lachnospiraceae bacterium]